MARRIGKTHRMIEEALRQAREGRAVYIMAANHAHQRQLRERVIEQSGDGQMHGIQVEVPRGLRTMDWHTGLLLGAHPNCRVLADHFTIEDNFRWAIEELHRYDHAKGE